MKRDIELIRKILIKLEESTDNKAICDLSVDGYSMEEVAYHCKLIDEKGLATNYSDLYGDGGIESFGIGAMTDKGHGFIDKIKNENIWNKIKDFIVENGIKFAVETIIQLTPQVIASLL